MKRDALHYLRDIAENMSDAEGFIHGMSLESFAHDKRTLNAVVRSLEVIGEAAKRVPDAVRSLRPEIPWREMAGMRDKLIHDYLGVDAETVWMTVRERLPALRRALDGLMEDLRQGDRSATEEST